MKRPQNDLLCMLSEFYHASRIFAVLGVVRARARALGALPFKILSRL